MNHAASAVTSMKNTVNPVIESRYGRMKTWLLMPNTMQPTKKPAKRRTSGLALHTRDYAGAVWGSISNARGAVGGVRQREIMRQCASGYAITKFASVRIPDRPRCSCRGAEGRQPPRYLP